MSIGVQSYFFKDVIIGSSSVNAFFNDKRRLIVSGTTITENHWIKDILVSIKSERGLGGINDTGFVFANQDSFGIILNTSDQTVRLGVDLKQK